MIIGDERTYVMCYSQNTSCVIPRVHVKPDIHASKWKWKFANMHNLLSGSERKQKHDAIHV